MSDLMQDDSDDYDTVTVRALGDGDNRDGEEGSDDSDDGKNLGNAGTIRIPI